MEPSQRRGIQESLEIKSCKGGIKLAVIVIKK